jgi:hypothetical protein
MLASSWEKGCGSEKFSELFPFMEKEQTTSETAPERIEKIPHWQEIRQHRSEEENEGKQELDLKISEYIKILEFGKNNEEESGGAAPEEINGECQSPIRTV